MTDSDQSLSKEGSRAGPGDSDSEAGGSFEVKPDGGKTRSMTKARIPCVSWDCKRLLVQNRRVEKSIVGMKKMMGKCVLVGTCIFFLNFEVTAKSKFP